MLLGALDTTLLEDILVALAGEGVIRACDGVIQASSRAIRAG